MGRDARANMDGATFMMQRVLRDLSGRMAKANADVLGAFAVTLIVTRDEPGAAVPTLSTYSFTGWGERLDGLADEAKRAVALGHISQAVDAVEKNAAALRARYEQADKAAATAATEKPKEENGGSEEREPES